ncbi:MAG: Phosphoglycerate mutase [Humibacillus sp.]|nr:Phosphoglycerate mutase [Humibacillus sp.]
MHSRMTGELDQLVLVRHGESVGNVADADARRRGLDRLELTTRDADTPLSATGEAQAAAVAAHLQQLDAASRPEVVLCSPYVRAAHTAELSVAGTDVTAESDERLRERDLGAFDGLTGDGIRQAYPGESERRSAMGKFYYRPPGGESWTDVVLRVRQLVTEVRQGLPDQRVWIFTHQAVIMAFRYVLEDLDEQRLLEIDRTEVLGNCSLTSYARDASGTLRLVSFADTTHLDRVQAPTTHETPHPTAGTPDGGTPAGG